MKDAKAHSTNRNLITYNDKLAVNNSYYNISNCSDNNNNSSNNNNAKNNAK